MTRLTAVIMIVIGGSAGGCGTTYLPIYQEAIGSSGEITESIAGHTSDASVAKEQAVMAAYPALHFKPVVLETDEQGGRWARLEGWRPGKER